MPSFDNLHDLLDVLNYEKFKYVVLTCHLDKNPGGDNFNLNHFMNLKTRREKEVMAYFLRQMAEAIEEQMDKEQALKKKKGNNKDKTSESKDNPPPDVAI